MALLERTVSGKRVLVVPFASSQKLLWITGVVAVILFSGYASFVYKKSVPLIKTYTDGQKTWLTIPQTFEMMRQQGVNTSYAVFNEVFAKFSGIDKKFDDDEIGELIEIMAEHGLVTVNGTFLDDVMETRSYMFTYQKRAFAALVVALFMVYYVGAQQVAHYERCQREEEQRQQQEFLFLRKETALLEHILDSRQLVFTLGWSRYQKDKHELSDKLDKIREREKIDKDDWDERLILHTKDKDIETIENIDQLLECQFPVRFELKISNWEETENDIECNQAAMKHIRETLSRSGIQGVGWHVWVQNGNGRTVKFGKLGDTKEYEADKSNILGTGQDSAYRCRDSDGKEYALKIYCGESSRMLADLRTAQRLKKSKTCENVVEYHGEIVSEGFVFVLMDLIDGVDGFDLKNASMTVEGITMINQTTDSGKVTWLSVSSADAGHAARAVSKADAITCINFHNVQARSNHWESIYIGFTSERGDDNISLGVELTSDASIKSCSDDSYLTDFGKLDKFQLIVQDGQVFLEKNGVRVNNNCIGRADRFSYYGKVLISRDPSSPSSPSCTRSRSRGSSMSPYSPTSRAPSPPLPVMMVNMEAKLQPEHMRRLSRDLMTGLDHIHSGGSIHCDMKPDNVMIINSFGDLDSRARPPQLKIIDFGRARSQATYGHGDHIHIYSPPEATLARKLQLNASFDMFGASATLYFFAVGAHPLPKFGVKHSMPILFQEEHQAWKDYPGLREFLLSLLAVQDERAGLNRGRSKSNMSTLSTLEEVPGNRPSARDSLLHEYFSTEPEDGHCFDS